MGKLLNVVAYVSGLEADGGDILTDYVLKKRNHLGAHANALADFGNAIIGRQAWRSTYPAEHCVAETIVETNLANRPELHKLRKRKENGEELSLVVVEPNDLCRENPHEDEIAAFEEIAYPYISTIFAAGFSHSKRKSPLERAKTSDDAKKVYQSGKEVLSKIFSTDHHAITLSDLDDLQRELLAHTSDANGMLQKVVKRKV
tara:strand:- start:4247 stop:4852 length:606 start_codon:yes stop_codon:yes gene_type:complete